ncbi:hypothetical protein ACGF12_36305 [Kitasatospora sp. NPDC048296]|uniref:hypothetical protein n=1 Tax=Kitasatospora sp. NPDC048296 TaxID=3364048 RepID=UPI00371A55E7
MRIAIIERRGLVRRGLVSLLESSPLVHLTAVAANAAELEAGARGQRLDAVVLGVPAGTRQHLTEAVSAAAGHGRVLVIAEFAGGSPVSDTLYAGATDAFSGSSAPSVGGSRAPDAAHAVPRADLEVLRPEIGRAGRTACGSPRY